MANYFLLLTRKQTPMSYPLLLAGKVNVTVEVFKAQNSV